MKYFDRKHISTSISGEKRKKWLEHHFYTSERLALAFEKIREIMYDPKLKNISHKNLQKRLYTIDKILQAPRSLLDDHYHHLICNSEFVEWSHIYYNEGGKKESYRKSTFGDKND